LLNCKTKKFFFITLYIMSEFKNILLLGRTGAGKSALANVITETNNFTESAGSVSETAKAKAEKFKTNFRVIDTIGFQDTTLDEKEELLPKFRDEIDDYICEGIYQILLVIDKRVTKDEIEDFKWFSTYLFDKKVFDYTTIVRTHFPNFEDDNACNSDIKSLIESSKDEDIKKLLKGGRIIYVDNDSVEKRKKSQNKLFKYMVEIDKKWVNNYKPMTSKSIKERFYSLKKEISSLLDTFGYNIKNFFTGWWFSSNSSKQQPLSKKLRELYELKEIMEEGKLINKDLANRDLELSGLISKLKGRLNN
jgi:GTP-binding protein EngB required for normal cell division